MKNRENNTTPVFEFRKVSFCYPEETEPVLKEISFSLYEGEIAVLAGQSGCGKSTLLRHMKKNRIPFGEGSGDLLFMGKDLEALSDRQAAAWIGYVGQDPDSQLVTDKVYHELAFGLENLSVPSERIRRRVAEISEYLGISQLFRKTVDTLSGGQKQIVNLASVLVMKPKLLILDEPTAQMDPIAANRFIQTLVRLNRDFGTTMMIAEQRLEEVLPAADRVFFMQDGRLLADGDAGMCGQLLQEGEKKAGKTLAVRGALPAAVRLSMACGTDTGAARADAGGDETDQTTQSAGKAGAVMPLSVRDGRKWLRGKLEAGRLEVERKARKNGLESWEAERGRKKKQSGAESRKAECEEEKNGTENRRTGRRTGKKEIVLSAKNIIFSYERGKPVLSDFSMEIEKGEITAILGGNGSGKTTAVKIMSGVYRKGYRGKIKKDGKTLYLAQNPQSLFTELSAWEELLVMGADDAGFRKEAEEMMHFLDLWDVRENNPMDLSGGEKQRLALGKILLRKPDILFLDEPTKGLDASFKERLRELFTHMRQQGIAVVMVSHDLEFCAACATRCGLLFDGSLVSYGTTREFFAGNSFYTTAVGRITQDLLPDCLLCEDVEKKLQKFVSGEDRCHDGE